jgi:TatD DNase family protein
MVIDTHSHLDHSRFKDDFEEIIHKSLENGVERWVIPGADPRDLQKAVFLSENHDGIYFAVGIHPYHINDWDGNEDLFKFVHHKKNVAIGECGLDYYRLSKDQTEREVEIKNQKELFKKQIRIAKNLKKPLIIHIRDASEDAKQILIEENSDEVGGVLHCYNADDTLLALASKNFYFGIGGVITFANAKKLVNILPKIPLNRILLETDAPYLTPHPHRGERNEPAYTSLVAKKVAEILNKSPQEIAEISTANAKQLFKNII